MKEILKPEEWEEKKGITVLDPDGWRIDKKSFDEPIEESEYDRRMVDSTIAMSADSLINTLKTALKTSA